ncbi:unnamed protein product [Prorocentrum cordatum]|uniref:Uncharacterized protein n=1 Tax=Prorocentrum cordatum TaxID=2364126 RepID=A0ABN9RST4_9DINO|nr:unnamed protein product [Polarella glacialis]
MHGKNFLLDPEEAETFLHGTNLLLVPEEAETLWETRSCPELWEPDVVAEECDVVTEECDVVTEERDVVTEECDVVTEECDDVTGECDVVTGFWVRPLAGKKYQESQQRSRASRYKKRRTPVTEVTGRTHVHDASDARNRAARTLPLSTLDTTSRYILRQRTLRDGIKSLLSPEEADHLWETQSCPELGYSDIWTETCADTAADPMTRFWGDDVSLAAGLNIGSWEAMDARNQAARTLQLRNARGTLPGGMQRGDIIRQDDAVDENDAPGSSVDLERALSDVMDQSPFAEDAAGDLGDQAHDDITVSREIVTDDIQSIYARLYTLVTGAMDGACDALWRVVACAVALHCFRLCDIGLREHCLLLHILLHDVAIRAHGGELYMYADGSWLPFAGLVAESVLAQCKRGLLRVEGLFLLVDTWKRADDAAFVEKCKVAWTSHGDTSIAFTAHCEVSASKGKRTSSRSQGPAPGEAEDPAGPEQQGDPHLQGERDEAEPNESQGEFAAKMAQKLSSALQNELLGTKLIKHYGEWCSTPKRPAPGVCFKDACLMFGPNGEDTFVEKAQSRNVYIHVPHALKDPVQEAVNTELQTFLGQTFWDNGSALDCQLAAMCLVLQGENIDRCFWTIGPGGVGQSLLTHLVDNVFSGLHAFLDTTVYYDDHELRKQAEQLVHKLITTGQEAVEGSKHGFREDLYKKHISADPIAARLPHGIVTHLVSLQGWKRLELNKIIRFAGVTAESINSIERRTWACIIKSRFVSPEVLSTIPDAASMGVFAKNPGLKTLVRSPQVAPAMWRILHGFMRSHSRSESFGMIEEYAEGGDGGTTVDCVYAATGVQRRSRATGTTSAPPVPGGLPAPFDPMAAQAEADRKLSLTLAVALLENRVDSITAEEFANKLGHGIVSGTAEKRKSEFDRLVTAGLWVKNGTGSKGNTSYVPAHCFARKPGCHWPGHADDDLPALQEQVRCRSVIEYAGNAPRCQNVAALQEYWREMCDFLVPRQRGRLSARQNDMKNDFAHKGEKLVHQERELQRLAEHMRSQVGDADGVAPETSTYAASYSRRGSRRSRLYLDTYGVQALSNAAKHVVIPDAHDWDISKCMFTIALQLLSMATALISHEAIQFECITALTKSNAEVLGQLGVPYNAGKKLFLKVVNGGRIPGEYSTNSFLKALQQEGILLRWFAVAMDTEAHAATAEACNGKALHQQDPTKHNPAASSWYYTWTLVEDLILNAWSGHVISTLRNVSHLSLHYDGLMINPEAVADDETFAADCQGAILRATGFDVSIVRKTLHTFLELVKLNGTHARAPFPVLPKSLLKNGNCIPAALATATQRQQAIGRLASASNAVNKAAERKGYRTYEEASSMCDVHLHPLRTPEQRLAEGWHLLHVENNGLQHCVPMQATAAACTIVENADAWTVPRDAWKTYWDEAVDRKFLVLFQLATEDLPGDAPERHLLRFAAGARAQVKSRQYNSYPTPKRGKQRLLQGGAPAKTNKGRTGVKKTAMKRSAMKRLRIPKNIPYVPAHQKAPRGESADRVQAWSTTLTALAKMTHKQTIDHLRDVGILPWWDKGSTCPICGSNRLGPLKFDKTRGWTHRCNSKACMRWVQPHACHPIFSWAWGASSVPLNKQAQVLFCKVAGVKSGQIHLLTGVPKKTVESLSARWRRAVQAHVLKRQRSMKFGNLTNWTEVEVDETVIRGKKDKKKQRVIWFSYCGLVTRGDRRPLVLLRLPTKTTRAKRHGKGKGSFASPGPITKKDWLPICEKYVTKRKIILHSDGARAYRYTRVPGVIVDTVRHKRPRPIYAARWRHVLPLDFLKTSKPKSAWGATEVRWVKKGTQIIDKVWGTLKSLIPKGTHAHQHQVESAVREAQWFLWNKDRGRWRAAGEVCQ